MITKTKEVYYCEHCKKHGLSKSAMIYHESICFNNPINFRPCFGCNNLQKETARISGVYYDGSEWFRNVDVFYCTKKDIYLHTPKNEIKKNAYDLDDYENSPMPKKCEFMQYDALDLPIFNL